MGFPVARFPSRQVRRPSSAPTRQRTLARGCAVRSCPGSVPPSARNPAGVASGTTDRTDGAAAARRRGCAMKSLLEMSGRAPGASLKGGATAARYPVRPNGPTSALPRAAPGEARPRAPRPGGAPQGIAPRRWPGIRAAMALEDPLRGSWEPPRRFPRALPGAMVSRPLWGHWGRPSGYGVFLEGVRPTGDRECQVRGRAVPAESSALPPFGEALRVRRGVPLSRLRPPPGSSPGGGGRSGRHGPHGYQDHRSTATSPAVTSRGGITPEWNIPDGLARRGRAVSQHRDRGTAKRSR